MKKILTLFALVGLIVFSSCEGPEGPPGQDALMPQAFEIKNVNLTKVTSNHYQYARDFNPFIGGDLYPDEVVLVYRLTDVTNSGAPVWQLIPKTTNYDNGDVADYFFDFSVKDFIITVIASFDLATQTDLINGQTFRIVIIPSDLAASVNKNSYLDVMKAANLKESQIKDASF
ncbi:hypothetical protein [Flavobacterium sp. ASV13]|uniref:hypothetical protein n=1 Tax=Flavobacterium sp. ASV13 TaxID=1506583 RepID=UPI000554F0C8|nr:hypothetical protein [Flavobacterium sp. ASV13]